MLPAALWGLLLCLNPQQEPEVQNLIPEQLADAWHGNLDRWTIEDGQLIGRTTEPLARTEYLFWKGTASDFELHRHAVLALLVITVEQAHRLEATRLIKCARIAGCGANLERGLRDASVDGACLEPREQPGAKTCPTRLR